MSQIINDLHIVILYLPVLSSSLAWRVIWKKVRRTKDQASVSDVVTQKRQEQEKLRERLLVSILNEKDQEEIRILKEQNRTLTKEISEKEAEGIFSSEAPFNQESRTELTRKLQAINETIDQITLEIEILNRQTVEQWRGVPREYLEKLQNLSYSTPEQQPDIIEHLTFARETAWEKRAAQKERIWQGFDEFLADNLQKLQQKRVEEERRQRELERRRALEREYKRVLLEAESLFSAYNYREAIPVYEKALQFKPDDPYVPQRIKEARGIMEKFQELLDEARRKEKVYGFLEAIELYTKASALIPKEEYPIQKIRFLRIKHQKEQERINELLRQKKEEEKREKKKRNRFGKLIGDAKKQQNRGEFKQAIALYREAQEIFDDQQVQDSIDQCLADIKEEEEKKARQQRQFDKLKIEADALYGDGEIETAIEKLKLAQDIFPEDSSVRDLLKLYQAEQSKIREKERLEELATKRKENWEDFQMVLQQQGISCFYHFTDRSNIASIIRHGGLYSWSYCKRKGIDISKPGGSRKSWDLDRRRGKEDFVRLAYTKEHPMLYVARNDGRITYPVFLEISTEVAYLSQTEFADCNAAAFRYQPKIGRSIQHLKGTRFDILQKGRLVPHYNLPEEEKPYNQAEVLVKTWIPLRYILNINQFKDLLWYT